MSRLESLCHVPERNPAGVFIVITEILQMDVGEKSHLSRIQKGWEKDKHRRWLPDLDFEYWWFEALSRVWWPPSTEQKASRACRDPEKFTLDLQNWRYPGEVLREKQASTPATPILFESILQPEWRPWPKASLWNQDRLQGLVHLGTPTPLPSSLGPNHWLFPPSSPNWYVLFPLLEDSCPSSFLLFPLILSSQLRFHSLTVKSLFPECPHQPDHTGVSHSLPLCVSFIDVNATCCDCLC